MSNYVKAKYILIFILGFFTSTHALSASWTAWLDRDNPSGSGDYERLSQFEENDVCAHPIAIEALATITVPGYGQVYKKVTPEIYTSPEYNYWDYEGDTFHRFSPQEGLVCRNADQYNGNQYCEDYLVRFLCP
ncbi:MAG: hypothetical protein K6L81_14080 [Agarilytica sp.]